MHDFLTVGAPHPLQLAAVSALELPDAYYETLRDSYARKRDLLLEYLERADFRPLRPQGSYFVLCEIDHFLERFDLDDDVAFAKYLVTDVGVAGVPGSSFYSDPALGRHLIRFHFAADEEVLRAAGEKLLTIEGT